ncbi:hypothetical protein PIB30_042827 [Stylosanthes scabra]|uniref:Uncharacterized protein n=1 Tax=Stylosanthes scabra TaxID=79078 RepID=A0ABU6VD92_9FABA|nr:hypothetical protein [Stylosanthes scabra]
MVPVKIEARSPPPAPADTGDPQGGAVAPMEEDPGEEPMNEDEQDEEMADTDSEDKDSSEEGELSASLEAVSLGGGSKVSTDTWEEVLRCRRIRAKVALEGLGVAFPCV